MRIKRNDSPPPYLNRKDQMRMLSMVGLLTMVVIAISIAAKPQTWYWLTGKPNPAATQETKPEEKSNPEVVNLNGDTKEESDVPLKPNEFRLVGDEQNSEENRSEKNQPENNQRELIPEATEWMFKDVLVEGTTTTLKPGLLQNVTDNTGEREVEKDVYFSLLAAVEKLSLKDMQVNALTEITLEQLMESPDLHRGKLITVSGQLRLVRELPATPNKRGVGRAYEAWVSTEEFPDLAYRVICHKIPSGVVVNENLSESPEVEVTGYFFKKYSYATPGGEVRIAPMLIAQNLLGKDANHPPQVTKRAPVVAPRPGDSPEPPAEVAVLDPFERLMVPGSTTTLKPGTLDHVIDDHGSVRSKEADVYFALLAAVRKLPMKEMQRDAHRQVAFKGLMDSPDLYRGKLLTFVGKLHVVYQLSEAPNQYGVGKTYEAWVTTPESNNLFYRVICHTIPMGTVVGEQLRQPMPVEVTGYFFKRYGYQRTGGSQRAALVIAQRISKPQAVTTPKMADQGFGMTLLISALVIGVFCGLLLWRFKVSDQKFQQQHLNRLTAPPEQSMEELNDLQTTSAEDFFASMGEEKPAGTEGSGT